MTLQAKPRVRDKVKGREYARRHYQKNKATMKARAKAHTVKARAAVLAYLREYLAKRPCLDCGEADLIVLEFDHRAGEEKSFNIGEAVQQGRSLKTVAAEVAKCDVRCANCHRRKTYRERGFTHRT